MISRPTLGLLDACSEAWDAVVIGAGPAGSLAARQLARHGLRTLLVEAKHFPRFKVCGGCLSQRALAALTQLGLGNLVPNVGGVPLAELRIVVKQRKVTLRLPCGAVLTRQALDQALVSAALEAGVHFLPDTLAVIDADDTGPLRHLTLRHAAKSGRVRAKVVVCADGIGRSSIRHLPELAPCVAPGTHLGVGAVMETNRLSAAARERFASGRIVMHVAAGGYVGVACGEHDKTIVAAALAPAYLKRHRSPEAAVAAVLAPTGLPSLGDTSGVTWHGTPALTSRARRVAAKGIFVVGDSAGFVEPFTGEGMAWAAESVAAATPLVVRACSGWNPELAIAWEDSYRFRIRRQQFACRTLAALLRRPWAVSLALGLVSGCPVMADRLIHWLNQPSREHSPVTLPT
ncbi:MAG TPA: NAD(P)/FAD-dependent oxidoreductase [Pirellulaceae bacterium]|nr:NAD(P)/FAD-dependent oxidoreductase [Pirellulaceae bacterium]